VKKQEAPRKRSSTGDGRFCSSKKWDAATNVRTRRTQLPSQVVTTQLPR
jgi:hypothetical protein